jgi:hypothetical protein
MFRCFGALALILASLALTSCASSFVHGAEQVCEKQGGQRDTKEFSACVDAVAQQRASTMRARLAAVGAALSAAGGGQSEHAPPSATLAAGQQCPIGAYPWTDSWGNQICRRFSDQSTASVQAPQGQQCPTGSYPWTDSWGNSICRSFNTLGQQGTDSYDTSRGCPVGFHEWRDNWGNPICQRN